MAKRSLDSATSKLLTLVGTALAVLSLYFAKEILLPFFLAIFLSFILHPLARGLERFRVPRAAAVLTVMLLACGMIGSIGWLVTNQVIDLSGKLPEYKGNLIEKVRAVKGATRGRIQRASQTIEEIGKELAGDNAPEGTRAGTSNGGTGNEMAVGEGTTDESQRRADHSPIFDYLVRSGLSMGDREQDNGDAVEVKVVSLPPSPLTQFQTWLGPLVAPLTTAGVVLVLTLFLLLQREKMRNRVLQLVGSGNLRTATEALDDITRRVSNLLRMQLLVNSLYGVSVGVGLYLIGVPNAILWGILGLLLRFLPYVGPWIVAIMPISLSMAVFDDWSHVGMTVGLFVTLELLVNNFLEPWLYGQSTGVSSVGIIVAAIFWTWMWGPIGLILAMPMTVCIVVAGKYIPQFRYISVLLGDDTTMSLEDRYYQRLLAMDEEEADNVVYEYLKNHDLTSLCDDVLVPALCLAECDRHAGALKPEQQELIVEGTRELIIELFEDHHGISSESPTPSRRFDGHHHSSIRVLCIPARDDVDELASLMLQQLLIGAGLETVNYSKSMLAGEIVERASEFDAVVISAVPPDGIRHARYLCKRLRQRWPELPIHVGIWHDTKSETVGQRLIDAGATQVFHFLSDAMVYLRDRTQRRRDPLAEQQKALEIGRQIVSEPAT